MGRLFWGNLAHADGGTRQRTEVNRLWEHQNRCSPPVAKSEDAGFVQSFDLSGGESELFEHTIGVLAAFGRG